MMMMMMMMMMMFLLLYLVQDALDLVRSLQAGFRLIASMAACRGTAGRVATKSATQRPANLKALQVLLGTSRPIGVAALFARNQKLAFNIQKQA